jgi:amidase
VVGKTITDEVSLGILGENPHDGTPANPAAPGRVPGGSSSGSAAAVAGGACDFALGTDTGGSVRVPASFSGLYGIRPTHGRIDFAGICVQSPASDTCGWFARDAGVFARVGEVLLGEAVPAGLPATLLVAVDAFGQADDAVCQGLAPMVGRLARLIGGRRDVTLALSGLAGWMRAQRVLQQSEAYATFAPWLDRHNPRLAFSVARGLVAGMAWTEADRALAAITRREVTARMAELLPAGTILCLPTTPFAAPLRGLSASALAMPRDRITVLTCPAGHGGVPQVNLPGAVVDGAPVGLSIIGGRGTDAALLAVARAFAEG